eukprot:714424_1
MVSFSISKADASSKCIKSSSLNASDSMIQFNRRRMSCQSSIASSSPIRRLIPTFCAIVFPSYCTCKIFIVATLFCHQFRRVESILRSSNIIVSDLVWCNPTLISSRCAL